MKKKYAYTSLLASDDYLYGVIGLYLSLQQVNSEYPFHLIVTDNISQACLDVLDELEMLYTIVPRVDFICDYDNYLITLNKFHIYSLKQYDKVCFIDADALVKDNIDAVFKYTAPGFIVFDGNFLSGVLVLVNPADYDFEYFVKNHRIEPTDESIWCHIYDCSKVSDLEKFFGLLIHMSDEGHNEGKYWKYFELDTIQKVKTFLRKEQLCEFARTLNYFAAAYIEKQKRMNLLLS